MNGKNGANNAQTAFTIGQLASISGVSTRTLRHYEDMGLLRPIREINGYRTYSQQDAKRLAQILAMRACNLPLITIRRMLNDPRENVHTALVTHLNSLQEQENSLHGAIERTRAALAAIERLDEMTAKNAFESLKEHELKDFEDTYGKEARELYGNDAIDAANERIMELTRDEWDAKELLEESIKVQLRLAMASGDPKGPEASELARMHERWIRIYWGESYSTAAHRGLAQGYLADTRFRAYYDTAAGDGATEFLVKALEEYLPR